MIASDGLCARHGAAINRKKQPICSAAEGCTNLSYKSSGVCARHGAPIKKCSVEGCTTNMNASINGVSLCYKHGGKRPRKKCSRIGCDARAEIRESLVCIFLP